MRWKCSVCRSIRPASTGRFARPTRRAKSPSGVRSRDRHLGGGSMISRTRAALAVATSLLALQAFGARAQEAPAADAKRGRVIEEIIVTAQKREENVRDVPISMSVLDSAFLNENAITDFKDVAEMVPNARNDNSGEFNDVRIRGFGSPLSNKAFEQSVGLVIDGIPYGR